MLDPWILSEIVVSLRLVPACGNVLPSQVVSPDQLRHDWPLEQALAHVLGVLCVILIPVGKDIRPVLGRGAELET